MAGASKKRIANAPGGSGSSQEGQNSNSSGTRATPPTAAGNRPSPNVGHQYDGPSSAPPAGAPNRKGIDINGARISEAIGVMGWALINNFEPPSLPRRPTTLNNNGREIIVRLNSYGVTNIPKGTVYQYDVVVNKGDEKRGLIKKVWGSSTVQNALKGSFLFDGNKLAWAMTDKFPAKIDVNLDTGNAGKSRRKGDIHTVYFKPTKKLRFDTLHAYMAGTTNNWTVDCLEAINFLDHLLREKPSQRYVAVKRSFFKPTPESRFSLGEGVDAFKGAYASMRIVHRPETPLKLAINIDVANGTFWAPGRLMDSIFQVCRLRGIEDLKSQFNRFKGNWDKSQLKRELKRYNKVHVVSQHTGQQQTFCIDKFIAKEVHEHKFEEIQRNDQGEITNRQWVTVEQYFRVKYNITLQRGLPLIKTTKATYVPLDILTLDANQRFSFKLSDKQTSNMIKFAVTLPRERWGSIEHGVKMLDWGNDEMLHKFGVRVSDQPTKVKARLLPPPAVRFANPPKGNIAPSQTSQGRWRIDSCQFLKSNPKPLKAWGVQVIQGRGGCDSASAKAFIDNMIKTYKQHGGNIDPAGLNPPIVPGSLAKGGEMITDVWNATGNRYQMKPQLLVFIVPDRNAETYARIKKSCECRYGVVSQVMQASHVMKNQGQYISNVLMKINAKLGGATCQAVGALLPKIAPKTHSMATMCIGADVSHPAPGSEGGSYAALTMSLDIACTRYAAQVNTNGHRVEMIQTQNFEKHLGDMVRWWIANVGSGRTPQRIFYFRDGVSEGQYAHVLRDEVSDMKAVFRRLAPQAEIKITVVVASKRHHIRFFPETGGDRNGNPAPGTLVETGVTHPFENDFYLCAHSAIKGTARPVHYHVLLNETGVGNDELQQFIFEHSFQYARSTTPVSIFPAVYYAHLASQRARSHENKPATSSGKKESKDPKQAAGTSNTSDKTPTEVPPLMDMNNSMGINYAMWYI